MKEYVKMQERIMERQKEQVEFNEKLFELQKLGKLNLNLNKPKSTGGFFDKLVRIFLKK